MAGSRNAFGEKRRLVEKAFALWASCLQTGRKRPVCRALRGFIQMKRSSPPPFQTFPPVLSARFHIFRQSQQRATKSSLLFAVLKKGDGTGSSNVWGNIACKAYRDPVAGFFIRGTEGRAAME